MINFTTATKVEIEKERKRVGEYIGDNFILAKKELYILPTILMDDEQVLAFCSGVLGSKGGLVALSNKRVIYLHKGMFRSKLTSIPITKINSLSGETGLISGKIEINQEGSLLTISSIRNRAVDYFVNKFQELIYA